MRNLRAKVSAFLPSRVAMATISLHCPSCIPGMTLFTPIRAVLSTPHFTFLLPTSALLGIATSFYHASRQRQNAPWRRAFVLPAATAYKDCHAQDSISGGIGKFKRSRRRRLAQDGFFDCPGRHIAHDRTYRTGDFPSSPTSTGPHASLFWYFRGALRRSFNSWRARHSCYFCDSAGSCAPHCAGHHLCHRIASAAYRGRTYPGSLAQSVSMGARYPDHIHYSRCLLRSNRDSGARSRRYEQSPGVGLMGSHHCFRSEERRVGK